MLSSIHIIIYQYTHSPILYIIYSLTSVIIFVINIPIIIYHIILDNHLVLITYLLRTINLIIIIIVIFSYNDFLENELSQELENGRLVRLLCKFGFINERPEYASLFIYFHI